MADVVEYYIKCTTPEDYRGVLKILFEKGYVWCSSRNQKIEVGVGKNKYIVVYSGDESLDIPKNIAHCDSAFYENIYPVTPVIKSEVFERPYKIKKLNNLK